MKSLIYLLLLLSNISFAETTTLLAKVTNDIDVNLSNDLVLVTDNENNQDIKLLRSNNFNQGKLETATEYTVEQLINGELSEEHMGVTVLKIYSENFSAHQGGQLKIKYLYDIKRKAYREKNMDLIRAGDSWSLVNEKNEAITKINVKAKKTFGILVGIEDIELI
jgi:protein involved in polysaccharide export with SLBB domain